MSNTMTILIHGTFSSADRWYKPSSPLWSYLKKEFSTDYFETDPTKIFNWIPALATPGSRRRGGARLFDYCNAYSRSHGIKSFRLIGHSHGATVANICSHEMEKYKYDFISQPKDVINEWGAVLPTWKIQSIVMLAPFVGTYFTPDHRPNMDTEYVKCAKFFNFHSEVDNVVPDAYQNYSAFPRLRALENEVEFSGAVNHWDPTKLKYWQSHNLVRNIKNENG